MNDNSPSKDFIAEESTDYTQLLYKILSRWKWFIASLAVSLLIAVYFILQSTPIYNVTGQLMINDSKKGQTAGMQILGDLGFSQGNMFVENEIVELQSKNLMNRVVRELGINVSYVRSGLFRDAELYEDSPIQIVIDDRFVDLRDTTFYVTIVDDNRIKIADSDKKTFFEGNFSDNVNLGDYNFVVERLATAVVPEEITVNILSYESATTHFHKNLSVSMVSKNTNAISMQVLDPIPARGKDIFETLVHIYNESGVKEKQLVSEQTVAFINKRLDIIDVELSSVEDKTTSFKTQNRLTDLSADASLLMDRRKVVEAELFNLQVEQNVIQSIRNFLDENGIEYSLMPDLSLSDVSLHTSIRQYNEAVLKRNRLLLTAKESNPTVITLSRELDEMKKNIYTAIESSSRNLGVKIQALTKEYRQIDGSIASIPTQERQFRSLSRDQEIKERLFIFLLEKREESEIAKLMFIPAAKIIDDPRAGNSPVSPKKQIILLASFILGLLIPAAIIYIMDLFDTKVHSRKDVERVTDLPVIGEVPQMTGDKSMQESEDFALSESMHMAREKVSYILQNTENPVIMITSSIPGEGKSFIASSLAKAYAATDTKVLLIGCDLRNPQLHQHLQIKQNKGLSDYLANLETDLDKLIVKVTDHLHVIMGGTIPPNPTQLITGPGLGKLLEIIKSKYDLVVLDTPPVGVLSEGFTIAKYTDATVYIVRANVLDRKALAILKDVEGEQRIKNLSVLMNGVNVKERRYAYGYAYGYGYGYGYGPGHKK